MSIQWKNLQPSLLSRMQFFFAGNHYLGPIFLRPFIMQSKWSKQVLFTGCNLLWRDLLAGRLPSSQLKLKLLQIPIPAHSCQSFLELFNGGYNGEKGFKYNRMLKFCLNQQGSSYCLNQFAMATTTKTALETETEDRSFFSSWFFWNKYVADIKRLAFWTTTHLNYSRKVSIHPFFLHNRFEIKLVFTLLVFMDPHTVFPDHRLFKFSQKNDKEILTNKLTSLQAMLHYCKSD